MGDNPLKVNHSANDYVISIHNTVNDIHHFTFYITTKYFIPGTPLFFTKDRVDIIDYISMTTPTRSKFVFREPKLSYVTNVYMLPFDTKVWVATFSLLIIIIIFIYIISKWEWSKPKMHLKKVCKH